MYSNPDSTSASARMPAMDSSALRGCVGEVRVSLQTEISNNISNVKKQVSFSFVLKYIFCKLAYTARKPSPTLGTGVFHEKFKVKQGF